MSEITQQEQELASEQLPVFGSASGVLVWRPNGKHFEVPHPHAAIWLEVLDHPKTDDCPDPECMVCAMRDCPDHEPLHYHHDGCPCCCQAEPQEPTVSPELAALTARADQAILLWEAAHRDVVRQWRDARLGIAALTQAKEAAEAALLVKEAENQTLRGLLQKARDTYPCNICGWPRPFDAEHNICKCCGYQPGYDDPAIYKWDGAWWSRSAEGKPQILLAMEAALARLTAYIAARRELFTRVVPYPANDRLPIMLEARINELDLLEAHLSRSTKEPQ